MPMFQYLSNIDLDNYFGSLQDFDLIEHFTENEGIYVGYIGCKTAPHILKIRVDVPKNFPHAKLMFRTDSIWGYPHLIEEKGNLPWFCLNTPFGETPINQLNLEVNRLRNWISMTLREDLPARITDPEQRRALGILSAYGWEMIFSDSDVFKKDAVLTFIGDFYKDAKNFKKKFGYIHCVRNGSGRLYAYPYNLSQIWCTTYYEDNHAPTNYELPYIIVDEYPENINDFIDMESQYHWDLQTSRKLLNPNIVDMESSSRSTTLSFLLRKMESLLKESILDYDQSDSRKQFEKLSNFVRKTEPSDFFVDLPVGLTNEQIQINSGYEEYEIERDYKNMHFFCLGITQENKDIEWHIIGTQLGRTVQLVHNINDYQTDHICMADYYRHIYTSVFRPSEIDPKHMFGRGLLSNKLVSKKIAIVGLGAIGSIVADCLARGGVKYVGLWDSDVVLPGNLCRSSYNGIDIGENKAIAIRNHILSISPWTEVIVHGNWGGNENPLTAHYYNGDLYGNINYDSQEQTLEQLNKYDIIIDCTASEELLHFLSFADLDKRVISICITNHANELICTTNQNESPYELRKFIISAIEQDTKNFYVEGTGCYSPTFLANYSDIASKLHLFLHDFNWSIDNIPSTVYRQDEVGITRDRILQFKLENSSITLSLSSTTFQEIEEMPDIAENGYIGFLLGGYSADRKRIYITHVCNVYEAENYLNDIYDKTNGFIDYIGDFCFSDVNGNYKKENVDILAKKSIDESINTNNPLLLIRVPDGSTRFFLYKNRKLIPFQKLLH